MKKSVLVFLTKVLTVPSLFSQDGEFQYYKSKEIKTMLGRNRPGGGYASFSTGYSNIDGKHALLFRGRFSWIASHAAGIGFGATGFINEFHY